LKYYPCLKHDFHELFFRRGAREWMTFFLWVLLFLPLLAGAGLIWTLVFWLVLLYKYMIRKEKILTLAMLVFVCLINPIFGMTLSLFRNYPTAHVQSALGMVRNGYNPVLISRIENLAEKSPQDLENLFFLAYLYQKGGKYETALSHYRRIIQIDPSRYDIYLNIGNIYFLNGQNSWAIENYNRCVEINPGYAPAYYNASITYAREFNFEKAAEYKKQALKHDPNVLAFAEKDSLFLNSPTHSMIYQRIMGEVKDNFLNQPRRMIGKEAVREARVLFPGSRSAIPGGFFLLLLLILSLIRKDRSHAVICRKCGSVYCRKCQSFTGPDAYCSQCHHLFIKRDGIAPQAKKMKMDSIQSHRKRRRLLISLLTALIPGSSHFYLGLTFAGSVFIAVWASSITYLVFESALLENPLKASGGGISVISAVCVFLLVMTYLVANLRIHGRRS
jgi:tetratricopeptide (TPR) repeat protein